MDMPRVISPALRFYYRLLRLHVTDRIYDLVEI